ncbi:galactoside-binding lectin [Oesophagostomum dentatum]|uniref:Galectin n=1 Tax=Oesophagostomum dentatum TaxID=61180 RepID=A0A0B1T0S7_OESDE|nr:galactoside-binding lectin [Oesophagostomum dentatum]
MQVEGFEIWCNEKKVHLYKHRIPFSRVEYLQPLQHIMNSFFRFYKIPWESGFPEGHMRSGQRILVHGIPKGDRWNLDLLGRGGDILFHFNPRFKEKQVVRNSYQGGNWNKEEREGPFPFEKERGFDLAIQNEPYSIQIYVNNARIGTFGHRTSNPSEDYIGVRIDGDVEVTNIEYD